MKEIQIEFLENGRISESFSDDNLVLDGEENSVKITATFPEAVDKYAKQAYIRAGDGGSDYVKIGNGNPCQLLLESKYLKKGTLKVGFEAEADSQRVRYEPLLLQVQPFVELGEEQAEPSNYTVTVTVAGVNTVEPGERASVTNVGTEKDLELVFDIPCGESVQMQRSGEYIQWKRENDAAWNDLVELKELKGDKGDTPTVEELGLEKVDNTADLDKPVSTAVQQALNQKANLVHSHSADDVEEIFAPTPIKKHLFEDLTDGDIGIEGEPVPGQGKCGTALLFSGSESVEIPNHVADISNYTITFKMQTSQTGQGGVWYQGVGIIDGDVGGFHNDFGFAIVGGGYLEYGEGQEGQDNVTLSVRTKSRVSDGKWHEITLIRNEGTASMYMDGELQNEAPCFTSSPNMPGSLTIGRRHIDISADCYYIGLIDDIRFYSGSVVPFDGLADVAKTGRFKHLVDFEDVKEILGLENVDNTADADKPVSAAMQRALDNNVKHVSCAIDELDAAIDELTEPGIYRVEANNSYTDDYGYLNQESEVKYVFVAKYDYKSGYNSNMYSYANCYQFKIEKSSVQFRSGSYYTGTQTWDEWQDVVPRSRDSVQEMSTTDYIDRNKRYVYVTGVVSGLMLPVTTVNDLGLDFYIVCTDDSAPIFSPGGASSAEIYHVLPNSTAHFVCTGENKWAVFAAEPGATS